MPKLIITADDCGLSEANNRHVLDLHAGGYLTAASVLTNFPAHCDAFARFDEFPALDVGVHLNLSDGFPVCREQGPHRAFLRRDGRFRDKYSLFMRASFLDKSALAWARRELDAQMQRGVEADARLRHISTHHHFQMMKPLRRIVHDLAVTYGVDWVRGHSFFAAVTSRNFLMRPQRQGSRSFAMPDYMTAIQSHMTGSLEEYCAQIARLDGTIELVAHPGPAHDPAFPADMSYGAAPRYGETQRLIAVVDRLRSLGVV